MELVQDIVVALVALGAAAVIVRRVAGEFRARPTEPACEHCGMNQPDPVTPSTPQSARREA